jgi:uncharacterized ParB-like nuclease family protein
MIATAAMIRVDQISTSGGTQSRVAITESVVKEYMTDIQDGEILPPLEVHYDGKVYWLVDGFHRLEAYKRLGHERVPCDVTRSTLEKAQWASYGANKAHGLRRTIADKRKCTRDAIAHPMSKNLTDRKLAEHLGVSNTFISNIKAESKTKTQPTGEVTVNVDSDITQTEGENDTPTHVPCPHCGSELEDDDGECAVCHDPKTPENPPDEVDEDAEETTPSGELEEPRRKDKYREDRFGNPWPESAAADVRAADIIARHRRLLNEMKAEWIKLIEAKSPLTKRFNYPNFEKEVGYVKVRITEVMPYCVCPICGGNGCKQCEHRGWMDAKQYQISDSKWEVA